MKFNGKKTIMAAALSAIVAAGSFGTAITASAEQTYSIGERTTRLSGSWDGVSTYLVDSNGNQFSSSDAVLGNSYSYY